MGASCKSWVDPNTEVYIVGTNSEPDAANETTGLTSRRTLPASVTPPRPVTSMLDLKYPYVARGAILTPSSSRISPEGISSLWTAEKVFQAEENHILVLVPRSDVRLDGRGKKGK